MKRTIFLAALMLVAVTFGAPAQAQSNSVGHNVLVNPGEWDTLASPGQSYVISVLDALNISPGGVTIVPNATTPPLFDLPPNAAFEWYDYVARIIQPLIDIPLMNTCFHGENREYSEGATVNGQRCVCVAGDCDWHDVRPVACD